MSPQPLWKRQGGKRGGAGGVETPDDFIDALFKVGTGYLGWTPEVTLNTPIPQIVLAYEGKIDFVIKTNPFGGSKSAAKPVDKSVAKQKLAALDAIKMKAKAAREKKCQKPQKDF